MMEIRIGYPTPEQEEEIVLRTTAGMPELIRRSSISSGPAARPVAAASGLTMDARALLAGHGRVGSWMAIAVTVANDGPALAGELRVSGGAQGRTRFGVPCLLDGIREPRSVFTRTMALAPFLPWAATARA